MEEIRRKLDDIISKNHREIEDYGVTDKICDEIVTVVTDNIEIESKERVKESLISDLKMYANNQGGKRRMTAFEGIIKSLDELIRNHQDRMDYNEIKSIITPFCETLTIADFRNLSKYLFDIMPPMITSIAIENWNSMRLEN